MALDASKVRIAGTGSAVWMAPAGTTLPSDSTTALASAFVNLGYLDDAKGAELTQELKTKAISAWQSLENVRLVNQSLTRSVSFTGIESNKNTVQLAWGGATITATTGGAYSLTIPDASATAEYVFVIDHSDGATSQRIVIKRGVLKSLPKIKFSRTDAISYSFEISALVPADGSKSVVVYGVDAGIAS